MKFLILFITYVLRLLLFEYNFHSPTTMLVDQFGGSLVPYSFDPSTWQAVAGLPMCFRLDKATQIV